MSVSIDHGLRRRITPFSFCSHFSESSDLNSSVGQLLLDLPEEQSKEQQLASSEPTAAAAAARGTTTVVKGKRGRKPGQKNLRTDMKSKLERSRQSARECRFVQINNHKKPIWTLFWEMLICFYILLLHILSRVAWHDTKSVVIFMCIILYVWFSERGKSFAISIWTTWYWSERRPISNSGGSSWNTRSGVTSWTKESFRMVSGKHSKNSKKRREAVARKIGRVKMGSKIADMTPKPAKTTPSTGRNVETNTFWTHLWSSYRDIDWTQITRWLFGNSPYYFFIPNRRKPKPCFGKLDFFFVSMKDFGLLENTVYFFCPFF